ncbi:MAG: DUF4198 domain-containing protein [Myxococcota bacterium]|nr:DUF4198 domain-containing protein [Myxococcota bacterium]
MSAYRFVGPFVMASFAFLLVLGSAASASAHDFWMEADGVSPAEPGSGLDIRLWVGDSFKKREESPYSTKRALAFQHVSRVGKENLLPRATHGKTPVVSLSDLAVGGHLVAMTRNTTHITMPGWKFTTYLMSEKFETVAAARKAAGTRWSEGRERYTRYLKTLVQVGAAAVGAGDEVYGTVLGQRYELIPLNDPMSVEPGEALVLRLLFEGKPLEGLRVLARSPEHGEVEARTDANGVVRLVLPERGRWLLRSVHMRACTGCSKADWESFWASYYFAQPN